jgi:hypothetical protein
MDIIAAAEHKCNHIVLQNTVCMGSEGYRKLVKVPWCCGAGGNTANPIVVYPLS